MTNGTEPSLPLESTEQLGAISGQKVGYARVSSKDQNLDRQIEQLKAEKVFTYYTDKASGGSRERPGLDEAMRYVRAGDQLVVTSMDRCARSLTDLYAIVDAESGLLVGVLRNGGRAGFRLGGRAGQLALSGPAAGPLIRSTTRWRHVWRLPGVGACRSRRVRCAVRR